MHKSFILCKVVCHVVPDESFEDRVVRDDNGDEFGHYATREAAELVAQAIARKCGDAGNNRATRKI